MVEPVVLVHGGAGDIPDSMVEGKLVGVRKAAKRGYEVLSKDVARLVMEKTSHVLLVGEGAKRFAIEHGIPEIPSEQLVTKHASRSLREIIAGGAKTTELGGVGTVGAVAVDANGHVAVATSTGGLSGKLVGRVGDTPIPGSGGYADDSAGACSTTGHGESIMRFCLGFVILSLIKEGKSTSEATKMAVEGLTQRFNNTAGAITVTNKGEIGIDFTSKRMAWAYQRANKLCSGINKGEEFCEEFYSFIETRTNS
ncbi:hypothetical protein C0J52_17828 [Blattella germanica]|nr:hypothetical protein C0J52_17828 [Blattella germanica]